MSETVREIRFEHFRGLPDYACKLKGKSIVILSDNGKGKSCIVDGIEFLFSGMIKRFHGEGTGAIDAKQAIQHVQRKGEAAVELYFTPTNDRVRRQLSSSELEVPDRPTIEQYITNQPSVESFILRRSQILDFISDQDASRYKKYIQLLGLTDIDEMQRAFVQAAQLANENLNKSRHNLRNELAPFRGDHGTPESLEAVLQLCSAAVREAGLSVLSEWNDLESTLSTLQGRRSPTNSAEIDSLNRAVMSFERKLPSDIDEIVAKVSEIQSNLSKLRKHSEEAAAGGVIREGIKFFHEHEEAQLCPLCEKPLDENYSQVLERLNRRDQTLSELRENEELLASSLNELETKCQQGIDRLDHDLESKSVLDSSTIKALETAATSLADLKAKVVRVRTRSEFGDINMSTDLPDVSALRSEVATELTARRSKLVPADSEKLENAIALLKKAQSSIPTIRNIEAQILRLQKATEAAIQANQAFSAAREAAIQKVFNQIADKVLEYYKRLHDLEGSEVSAVSLTPTPRAATGGLRMVIEFLGLVEDADARAFLSEGHLDSLGLCIYLATVRIFNPPGSLLALDDVMTSIDKTHRHRVGELLFQEFADFQIVLTTHDEYWFNNLEAMAKARGEQGNWVFNKISRWTIDGGPESAAFESTWSYIDANLNEVTYRELGGPLRLVLEDFLKRVATKIELKVRYNFEGRYTAGEFVVAGVQAEILKQLLVKTPSEEAGIKTDLGRVFGGDLINFLSHDNPGRLEVTFAQTKDFVDGLKSLTKRCEENKLIKGVG